MLKIQRYLTETLSSQLVIETVELKNRVWPSNDDLNTLCNRFLDRNRTRPDRQTIVAWEDEVLVAHAEVFSRDIECEGKPFKIGCLSSVCVSPDRRKQDFGKAVVQEAFRLIDTNEYEVFLFQTTVPEFYQKLGARIVENKFINKLADDPSKNPWRDSSIMIYPSSYDWPVGIIDLNGEGY